MAPHCMPGRPQSTGSQRVGHNRVTDTTTLRIGHTLNTLDRRVLHDLVCIPSLISCLDAFQLYIPALRKSLSSLSTCSSLCLDPNPSLVYLLPFESQYQCNPLFQLRFFKWKEMHLDQLKPKGILLGYVARECTRKDYRRCSAIPQNHAPVQPLTPEVYSLHTSALLQILIQLICLKSIF